MFVDEEHAEKFMSNAQMLGNARTRSCHGRALTPRSVRHCAQPVRLAVSPSCGVSRGGTIQVVCLPGYVRRWAPV